MKTKMLVAFSSERGQKFLKVAGIAMTVFALALGPATAFASDTPTMPF